MEDARKERHKRTIENNYEKFEDITQNDLYENMQEFLDKFNNKTKDKVLTDIKKTSMILKNLEYAIKAKYFKE